MSNCESCGNEYERNMTIILDGRQHHFDCFECAIQMLAPSCNHCGTRMIGHGLQAGEEFYCCAHCARAAGASNLKDSA